MKGVILAGGTGSRLWPATKVTNKHLLPVFDKPMIYYPVETLKNMGITEILIITGPEYSGDFMQLLGSGKHNFNIDFTYRIQDGPGGIAQALALAKNFAAGDSLAVILSDNIFLDDFYAEAQQFKSGAQIFIKEVEDPHRFGVVSFDQNDQITTITEKPAQTDSNWVQTGLYFYDSQVFDFIKKITPSDRGELEISDVNKLYLQAKQLRATKINGPWNDAGTHESLMAASSVVCTYKNKNYRPHKDTSSSNNKISVGLLTYNSAKYLKPCLDSLLAQDCYQNMEIVILDNNSSDNTVEILRQSYPQIKLIISERNLGFGAGHNKIITNTNGQFYACLNIDMIFNPNFISLLAESMIQYENYGSVTGKLMRWNFMDYEKSTQGKTNFIDSAGIEITTAHAFSDIGQGQIDTGQFDKKEPIFGASGAAAIYRRSALREIAYNSQGKTQYFDEDMFMYKEDIDLAYRLQWANWPCLRIPTAVAYHDRTSGQVQQKTLWSMIRQRKNRPSYINHLSYLNHQLMMEKYSLSKFSSTVNHHTRWRNFKIFCYCLLFEPKTLWQKRKLSRLRSQTWSKKIATTKKVSPANIEKLMRKH